MRGSQIFTLPRLLLVLLLGLGIGLLAQKGLTGTGVPVDRLATYEFDGSVEAGEPGWIEHLVDISRPGSLRIALDWQDDAADLTLVLRDPRGHEVEAFTRSGKPRVTNHYAELIGTWTVGVRSKVGSSDYRLHVTLNTLEEEEFAFQGSVDASQAGWRSHDLFVARPGGIVATLSWEDEAADLSLLLKDPAGDPVASSASSSKPEQLRFHAYRPGLWKLGVRAVAGSSEYTLAGQVAYGVRVLKLWGAQSRVEDGPAGPEEAVIQAKRFGVITAPSDIYREHVEAMKETQSDLILLAHMSATLAEEGSARPDSWYLYDAEGEKVRSLGDGSYLMDPSHPGWVEDRAGTCVSLMAESGYHGCMLEGLGAAPLSVRHLTGLPLNQAEGVLWAPAGWTGATAKLAAEVKARVHPGFVFGDDRSAEALDGLAVEAWLRDATQDLAAYGSEAAWKRHIGLLEQSGEAGRPLLVMTRTWAPGSRGQKDAWHRYALASFLLAAEGNSYFSFSYWQNQDMTAWHPWWNLEVGVPKGDYVKEDGVYQRDYTHGKVLVNPSDATFTIPLEQAYLDLDGKERKAITLGPHQAAVLTLP